MAKGRTPIGFSLALVGVVAMLVTSERFAAGQSLTWRVASSQVTLLSRPTAGSAVVATARAGAMLELIGSNGEWFHVTMLDAGGVKPTGWIRAEDLHVTTVSKASDTSAADSKLKPAEKPVSTVAKAGAAGNAAAPRTTATSARKPIATTKTAAARTSSAVAAAPPVPAKAAAPIVPIVPARQLSASVGYITPLGYSASGVSQIARSEPPITAVAVRPAIRRPIQDRGGAWSLIGSGGISAQNTKAFTYSGQLSVRVSSWLEIVAEGGQFADVMSPATRSDVAETAAVLTQIGNETVAVDARMPATFGMAGMRFISDGEGIRPFVQATGGLAMLEPRVSFTREGQLLTGIAGASFQDKSKGQIVGVAGGVLVPLGSVATVELGYRVVRGFGASTFSVNQAVLGLGTRF